MIGLHVVHWQMSVGLLCNLLIVNIPLIQFGCNAPGKFWCWRDRHHYFERTGVRTWSAMVWLDRALVTD